MPGAELAEDQSRRDTGDGKGLMELVLLKEKHDVSRSMLVLLKLGHGLLGSEGCCTLLALLLLGVVSGELWGTW